MKSIAPNPQHQAFRAALERAIGEEGADIDVLELLALTAHLVGQLVAMQDQRKITVDMAMQVVISNIQQGNSEVVERLLNETGGHA